MSVADKAVLQLSWVDTDGVVTLTPEDEDRFSMKVKRVIAACQSAAREDAFRAQFDFLLNRLGRWLKDRPQVADAYLTLRDGQLFFLIVRDRVEYDADFEDALSELDVEIARDVDLDLIRMNAMALPRVSPEALKTFLDPRFSVRWQHAHGA
jgi:hypothetical protein